LSAQFAGLSVAADNLRTDRAKTCRATGHKGAQSHVYSSDQIGAFGAM